MASAPQRLARTSVASASESGSRQILGTINAIARRPRGAAKGVAHVRDGVGDADHTGENTEHGGDRDWHAGTLGTPRDGR
jgi:hypothetical protein